MKFDMNTAAWARIAAAVAVVSVASEVSAGTPANAGEVATYGAQVAPILARHCERCHRSGEIAASIPLASYETAQPRAGAIKARVLRGEMPPWSADPDHSVKFRNDPRLSPAEIDAVVAWVDGGAPRGDVAHDDSGAAGPDVSADSPGPGGRKPDAVFSLPSVSVPANGELPYVQLRVKVPYAADKWIAAMQVRPGNRSVVHHMAVAEVGFPNAVGAVDLEALDALARQMGLPSGALAHAQPSVVDPANPESYDMLAMFVPGTALESYGAGNAKLLRGGDNLYLNVNVHYTTTGKAETDRSQIAFWFQPRPPKHQLYRVPAAGKTLIANGRQLLTDAPGTKAEGTDVAIPPIPPFADNYELVGVTAFTRPVTIYQLQPHAHLRAKDFKYTVVFPDGREQTILSVPKYDYHWQLAYDLESPLRLPAGSKLVVVAHYDNSVNNAHLREAAAADTARRCGPDKQAYFRGQNQTWDEMFSPIIQYSIESGDARAPAASAALGAKGDGTAAGSGAPSYGPEVVETVGCLVRAPTGGWLLTHAGDPRVSAKQSTSGAELAASGATPLGQRRYRLLGTAVFSPQSSQGGKVAVKAVLIPDAADPRLNVTSLQSLGRECG